MNTSKYISTLRNFYEYMSCVEKTSMTMIIGFNVTDPKDTERNINYDIVLNDIDNFELNKFLEKNTNINYAIININFNSLCVLNKTIVTKYNNANKLKSIIFDSSTFKFLSNIKMIALFYYLLLEENGSIYIESNSSMSIGMVITNFIQLEKAINTNKDGFYYQTGFILPKSIETTVDAITRKKLNDIIVTREDIYTKNIEYLKKWLYGSNVELLENYYPITNERYPITKYYKISKKLTHQEILNYLSINAEDFDKGLSLKTNSIIRM